MRKIYPVGQREQDKLDKITSFRFTEEQYKAILDDLAALSSAIQTDAENLDEYKQQLREHVITDLASITTLNVSGLSTLANTIVNDLTANDITAETLTADRITALIEATISTAAIETLASQTATINDLSATDAEITNLTVDNLNASSVTLESYDANSANIDTLSSADATVTQANIDSATIDDATVGTADISSATISDLESTNIDVSKARLQRIINEFTNHNDEEFNKQTIDIVDVSADNDFWIILPKFKNGTYYLIASDLTNGLEWSMEIENSIKNISFTWSISDVYPWLKDVEIVHDQSDDTQYIQIHGNTNGLQISLYHRCDDFNNTIVPQIYATKQIEGTKKFEFTKASGRWMPNPIFAGELNVETLEVETIEFDKVTINKEIILPTAYDQYGDPIGHTAGSPGQYISNVEDEYGNHGLKWETPSDKVARNDEKLITSDAVSEYDGSIDNPDYDEDDPTSPEKLYPITHLGDDTVVHGDAEIEGELKTPNLQVSGETYSELDISSGLFIGIPPEDISDAWLVKAVLNGVTTWYEIINNSHGYAYLTEIDTADYFDIIFNVTVTSQFGPWATCSYNNMENLLMVMKPWTSGEPQEFAKFIIMSSDDGPKWKDPKLENVEASLSNITQIADDGVGGSALEYYIAKKTIAGGFNNYRIKQFEGVIKADPLLAENSDAELEHGKPLIYNKLRAAAETSDELEIDKLTADDLVADEVYTRDLHVTGHAYINDTVEEEVVGNYLTLRADNSSAMTTNETSGILINNTDGNGNIVALVSDKDGTARVGDVTGTRTTYPSLYLSDNKYYTDASYQTEVTPQGSMVSWDSKEELDDGAIHWTNAVFVVISSTLTDLQPLLTRDEEVNLNDKGILLFDKDDHRAETLPLPDTDEQTLEAHVSSNSTVVFTDGTDFYDESMSPTTEPEGTAGTPVSLGQFVYYNDTWFYYDGTDYYDSVDSWTDHTNYTLVHDDQSLIDALDAETKKTISSVVYTESPTISYQWKPKQAGILHFATMSDYETYALSHNVPNDTLIVIDNETSYVVGDEQ